MADRSLDWFRQAERDLEQAADSAAAARHEWACFASHQAAEKAVKAVHLHAGQEAWGHVISRLLQELPQAVDPNLIERAKVPDNFYIPARYPDSHPDGSPFEHFGALQSAAAIDHAHPIIEFARSSLAAT